MSILHALLIWLLTTLCKLIMPELQNLYSKTKQKSLKGIERDLSFSSGDKTVSKTLALFHQGKYS